jgi:glycerol-3-phosphate acyltransferase PlsY
MTSSRSGAGRGSLLASLAAGYFVGLFPSADLAARLAGRDGEVRRAGSKNPGATNAAKVLGRTWGAVVLAGDVAKGAAGSSIGRRLAGEAGAAAGGVGAVLGHCFPYRRRGGKGVASRYGALAVLAREICVIDLATAAIVTKTTRKPGTAMTVATVVSAVFGAVLVMRRSRDRDVAGVVLSVASGAVVLFRFFRERNDRGRASPAR